MQNITKRWFPHGTIDLFVTKVLTITPKRKCCPFDEIFTIAWTEVVKMTTRCSSIYEKMRVFILINICHFWSPDRQTRTPSFQIESSNYSQVVWVPYIIVIKLSPTPALSHRTELSKVRAVKLMWVVPEATFIQHTQFQCYIDVLRDVVCGANCIWIPCSQSMKYTKPSKWLIKMKYIRERFANISVNDITFSKLWYLSRLGVIYRKSRIFAHETMKWNIISKRR